MKQNEEKTIDIKKIRVGRMDENCYFIIDTESHHTVVIDPGDEGNFIAEQLASFACIPTGIIATHGHFDHIMGAAELQMIYHIPFSIHEADVFLVKRMKETAEYFLEHMVVETPPAVDRFLTASDTIRIGAHTLSILSTPGHTPGSVCYYIASEGILFVGDTLFAGGGVGRSDFSYSDKIELNRSISKILKLPDDTELYPGHGERTSVREEKGYRL